MISFGRKRVNMTNKKKILGLKMQEKHLKSLGFEPTTVLDYSKPLSNFTGHFRGQNRTEHHRDLDLYVRTEKVCTLDLVSALRNFAQRSAKLKPNLMYRPFQCARVGLGFYDVLSCSVP